ncbi:helix-turn-helix domain-containing protein [Curtobacterium caseinilyticum]|uniref:Helix-turn-helix transcriptional regulator n=1 Tax=Curtobacterium caseinilyticum TaxID=3055137 RepID=A0ABT7TUD6_9MICO|nr:helix-turn-helix transcriptional regulator [Curtobacterium caseinilyticum]MDM7892954.1 helix-turn-helix transcriptional regulator [Curtobacterium caseinilyticum]
MSQTRIVELRTQRGWTQQRLAEASGVTIRTLQRLEAGNDVSLDTLSRLGQALGVPVRDLFVHAPETDFGRTASAVSRDEVRRFSTAARGAWRSIARGVALFVVSPIPVVLLIAGADEGVIPASAEVAIAAGLGLLLLVTAVGALQLLQASTALAPFRFVRQKQVPAGGDAAGWAERIARTQREHRAVTVRFAVGLWISSPLPLIIVALSDPSTFPGIWTAAATTFLLVIIACGVFAVLRTAWPSYVAGKLTTGVEGDTVR